MSPNRPLPAPGANASSAVDERLVESLERAFASHAGGEDSIDPPRLQKALGLRSDYLAKRVFQLFDTDGDGKVQRAEFLAGVRALVTGTDREKLHFAFRLHDHDGDGAIDRHEMLRMIALSLAESRVAEKATQPPEHLTKVLFTVADQDGDGRISFDELEAVVRTRPALLAKMTRSEALWIAPNEDLLARLADPDAKRPAGAGRVARFFQNALAKVVLLTAWALANVAIFAIAMRAGSPAPNPDPWMQVGRALGKCIDFDGALIFIPVMRRLLTRVRASWAGRAIPVDSAIDFHKIVGHTLFALAVAHAATFLVSYTAGHAGYPVAQLLFHTRRGASGFALLVVFAVMTAFSLAPVRRSSRFELFYFTHLLYVAWLVLAVVHATSFLFLAGVPVLGFAIEQILRARRRAPASAVVANHALRSGVTRLEIAKPPGFTHAAGDYAFLRIPAIAGREWHPFTISSAPEKPTLTFHVRSLGNWTSALRERVEAGEHEPLGPAYVDGPYGSPSAHIFAARHAVLIGAGIGVTPFASVLESIVLRGTGESALPSRLEKVHFFWLNEDQYSFEWFAALLSDLEARAAGDLLDIHLCMTGGRSGATSLGLELARDIMHSSGRSDLITGLRTHTHVGRPDWEALLGAVVRQHAPDRVDVFFCGPPGLGAALRPLCARLGMRFREERF